jgi:hypothetical protein
MPLALQDLHNSVVLEPILKDHLPAFCGKRDLDRFVVSELSV